jgi:hypothetical protein
MLVAEEPEALRGQAVSSLSPPGSLREAAEHAINILDLRERTGQSIAGDEESRFLALFVLKLLDSR